MLPFQHRQQDTLYPLALIPIRPSPQLLETIYPLCDYGFAYFWTFFI